MHPVLAALHSLSPGRQHLTSLCVHALPGLQAGMKPRSFNNPESKFYSAAQQRKEMKEMAPLMPDRLSDPLLDVGA